MSAQEQARALMNRHHHLVKNRQQSMLSRAAVEVGMPAETEYWNHIQGKALSSQGYDRSGASFS
ncbi:MAG: hypothetical protein SFW36_00360 [Leptolyngbyaceae cyanobacterium bins.59]|nr:hypothetical protein [Leptolyngbyaceae cyanobacterium bins.59]